MELGADKNTREYLTFPEASANINSFILMVSWASYATILKETEVEVGRSRINYSYLE